MSFSAASASSSSREPSSEPQKTKPLKRKQQPTQSDSGVSDSEDDSDSNSGRATRTRKADTAIEPDEKVLSHAEQRKQKKLAKRIREESTAEGSPSSKKRKLKDGSAQDVSAAARPRQNSVWVGNLSFKTTQENLKTFFTAAGEVTRINLPTKVISRPNMPLENKGFAYVDFATPEGKLAAIGLSEKPLIGRKLLIKDGDDFGGRPIAPGADVKTSDSSLAQKVHAKSAQKILRQQKQPPAPTLFVGNLPFETTEEDIKSMFELHRVQPKETQKSASAVDDKDDDMDDDGQGEDKDEDAVKKDKKKVSKPKPEKKDDEFILKIRMGTFEDSGTCKGFAFIDFSSLDNATSALIDLKNHHFNGRDLKVEYAGLDAVRRGAAKHLVPAAAMPKGRKHFHSNGSSSNDRPRPPRTRAPRQDEGELDADDNSTRKPARLEAHNPREGDVEAVKHPQRRDPRSQPRLSKTDFAGKKGPRARPTPGAALALAKRETAAIIPSQGKKITF